MKKLVILDHINEMTYVCEYNTKIYNDALECIYDFFNLRGIKISINNVSFMEVEEFNLKVL